ncbi:MAG: ATP-binding protein [Dehalococcoidales bacterium]
MTYTNKTKAELINELIETRRRIAELQAKHEQLQQREKILQEEFNLSKRLADIVKWQVIVHELRTPLSTVLGYTDMLLRHDPPEATRKQWLKGILDSSKRIAALVDDFLNVARIQSGRVSVKLENVRLLDVVGEQLTIIRESTSKHEFIVNIEPDLPDVFIDRDMFIHVLENLLSNAVKYSPNGGHITVSAHHDMEQHQVVVSVADEGIGISLADKSSLFTTFHRIQRSETRDITGSGLGLYIAKEWMERMGGAIWLESELNKGSTFFVGIPTQNSDRTG